MEKPELIYVYDPLCGWCYGFSPVMQQFKNEYSQKINFSIFSGGLAIGNRALPINVGYGYIKNALESVEKASGVLFGKGFKDLLVDGNYMYNSEPPCIALAVFKELEPGKAFEFGHDLHHLIFHDGKDLNKEETYYELLDKYKVNRELFSNHFNSPVFREKTYNEFKFTRELEATAYPTVILKKNNEYITISRGFINYEQLKQQVEQYLN